MKKVAILQSNYIPWKGYFDIIHDVDLFIFYDDVQYTKNDWRNRNKVKTPKGASWLTIPIGPHIEQLIYEVQIQDIQWQKRHWSTIQQCYSKAPFYRKYQEFFQQVYLTKEWGSLSELNQYLIKTISEDFLGIKTKFKDSREYSVDGQKLNRLIDLLNKAQADLYISGPAARDYIDEGRFQEANIKLVYKDYSGYPEYPQFYPPFDGYVSIIDLLFQVGPDAPDYIWGWREE